jgi:hypothetical protein
MSRVCTTKDQKLCLVSLLTRSVTVIEPAKFGPKFVYVETPHGYGLIKFCNKTGEQVLTNDDIDEGRAGIYRLYSSYEHYTQLIADMRSRQQLGSMLDKIPGYVVREFISQAQAYVDTHPDDWPAR